MIFPIKDTFWISTPFDELRPLTVPPKERTHVHGAIDISARTGTTIHAPERGTVFYFAAIRDSLRRTMKELDLVGPFDFRGEHYFYDTYGGIVLLFGQSGWTHLFCHSYLNQLFNKAPLRLRWKYHESPVRERWPLFAWHTFEDPTPVSAGETIGFVGSAGQSSGPHLHYEIHHGTKWETWGDRVNPETLWTEAKI